MAAPADDPAPGRIAADDSARKLDCAVRTIWRDLSALQKAGFPLYDDKSADGRRSLWKLEEQFTLGVPVKLSRAETAALVMSRDLLRPVGAGGPRRWHQFVSTSSAAY